MSIEQVELPEEEKERLLSVFPEGVIAIDLETSGLSPLMDKIVELSAIKLTPAKEIETFHRLINPEIRIPQIAINIHKITNEMVKDAPTIDIVLPEFIEFADDMPLIAHNAKFDIGFIVANMHWLHLNLNNSKVYCSIQFARKAIPNAKSYKLSNLADSMNIPIENHHRAMDDALASMRIFARCLEHTDEIKAGCLFSMSDFNKNRELTIPAHLKLLEENIHTQTPVEIMYNGGSHRGQWRPIRPISLLPMPNGNVLYAHCLITDIYKSFVLKKISKVRGKDT